MRRIFATHYDECDDVKLEVIEAAEFFEGQEGRFWVVRPIGKSVVLKEAWCDISEEDATKARLSTEYGVLATP